MAHFFGRHLNIRQEDVAKFPKCQGPRAVAYAGF